MLCSLIVGRSREENVAVETHAPPEKRGERVSECCNSKGRNVRGGRLTKVDLKCDLLSTEKGKEK